MCTKFVQTWLSVEKGGVKVGDMKYNPNNLSISAVSVK